jgi:hypothetical protein
MPVWHCEFRTTLSGKIEADTPREALRKFTEALDALDLGVGDVQDFRLDLSRSGYATEIEAIEPKPKSRARRTPPWGSDPTKG